MSLLTLRKKRNSTLYGDTSANFELYVNYFILLLYNIEVYETKISPNTTPILIVWDLVSGIGGKSWKTVEWVR